jgi:ectoine hydroxylase
MTNDPYVSRTGDSAVGERFDPVLWGSGAGPLSSAELERFEEDGFIVKDKLFGEDELAAMMEELGRLPNRYADRPREETVSEPETGVLRSVFRVHRVSPVFANLARDPRLAETARQILGSDVYVHQSRVNFKRAFDGRAFPWHSDFETWHMEDGMPRMRALSASVLLTQNTPVNGPLMLIRGSHKRYVRCAGETPRDHYKESLRNQRYGVPSKEALTQLTEQGGLVQALGAPGSVIFFDCNTMHGSSGNMSPYPRHNVFFVFNSAENALEAPFCGLPARPDFLAERSMA